MNENRHKSPIEPDLEARLVAWVLGEASDFETEELQRLMQERPELAVFKREMEQVSELVRSVGHGDLETPEADWKLPSDRRQAVLDIVRGRVTASENAMATSGSNEWPRSRWRRFEQAVSAVVAISIMAVLIGLMLPAVQMRRTMSGYLAKAETDEMPTNWEAAATSDPGSPPIVALHDSTSSLHMGDVAGEFGASVNNSRQNSMDALSSIRDSLQQSVAPSSAEPEAVLYFTRPESGAAPLNAPSIDAERFHSFQTWSAPNDASGNTNGDTNGIALPETVPSFGAITNGSSNSMDYSEILPDPGYRYRRSGVAPGQADKFIAQVQVQPRIPAAGTDSDVEAVVPDAGTVLFGGIKGGDKKPMDEISLALPVLQSPEKQFLFLGRETLREKTESNSDVTLDDQLSLAKEAEAIAPPQPTKPGEAKGEPQFGQSTTVNGPVANFDAPIPDSSKADKNGRDKTFGNGQVDPLGEMGGMGGGGLGGGGLGGGEMGGTSGRLRRDVSGGASGPPSVRFGTGAGGVMPNSEMEIEKEVTEFERQSTQGLTEQKDLVTELDRDTNDLKNREDVVEGQHDSQSGEEWQKREKYGDRKKLNAWQDEAPSNESTDDFAKTKTLRLLREAPSAGLNETNAATEAFSTFSLHVSDVSFKLAAAALARGEWPEAAKIRIEEFVNALDYGDPLPGTNEKVACVVEQAIHPFLQQRNVLRVSMRTSAEGRSESTPLRLTLVLDNSGSMERIDRQRAVQRALSLLAQQLSANDQVTLISFARQPRLLAENVSGPDAGKLVEMIGQLPSEGGTNIEAALQLAFEKAAAQRAPGVQNRIVLLTDGAVNLGNADPESLSRMVETMRTAGIAFDAAGISAEGLNDEVLEALTRKGDGRYYLLDGEESSGGRFAQQIAGALRPSASNVKVQVEFNPRRVGQYKLLGFEKHILNQEDFRNDAVDAAELAAAEAGVAVYQFEAKPDGEGDVGSVSVRFRDLVTGQMVEQRWPIPYEPNALRPDQASNSLRLATAAAMLAARLRGEALGETVDLKSLSDLIAGLSEQQVYDPRVQQLKTMIEQARQLSEQ